MSSTASASDFEYQFAGVRVDVVGHRLRVDGKTVHGPARVFELLALLCEANGRVRSRDDLLAALWSADEDVSDESLTQLVFRLRAVLGPYAETIVTVRGVGVRLSAELSRVALAPVAPLRSSDLTANPARPERRATAAVIDGSAQPDVASDLAGSAAQRAAQDAVAPVQTLLPTRYRSRRIAWILAGAFALVIVALAIWQGLVRVEADAWLDQGHGVHQADAHVERSETLPLLRAAFDAEAQGDRERAITLLQSAHSSDARTPLAALYLAYFAISVGDPAARADWLNQAQQRIAVLRDPYLDVLLGYIRAVASDDWNDQMRTTGALLVLRPQAWAMRAARAHLFLERGMRDAALQELKAVAIRSLYHRKLEMILADRASLGDAAGADAILASLPKASESPAMAFLQARIAYSRGDMAAAGSGYARAVELGLRANRLDIVAPAQVLAGITAMNRGDLADARLRIADGFARQLDQHRRSAAADIALVVAQMEALAGNPSHVAAAIAQVRALLATKPPDDSSRIMSELFALRLIGSTADSGLALEMTDAQFDRRGAAFLLAARRAWLHADTALAKERLNEAIEAGVLHTDFADEAVLLAHEVGLDIEPLPPIDPPYPPLARFASRWATSQKTAQAR